VKWMEAEGLTLPEGKTKEDLIKEAGDLVDTGYQFAVEAGLVAHLVKSEVDLKTSFNGFRMFGKLDFLVDLDQGYFLFDGKGHQEKNADVNQLLYYGLQLHSTGKPLRGGGFIYWRYGYEPVDLSPKALKAFVEGPFQKGKAIFLKLAEGVEKLEATPSQKACFLCQYKSDCEMSVYRKGPITDFERGEVGLG